MRRIALAAMPVALSLLSACASETVVTAKSPEAETESVCTREAPTGSKLVATQCRTIRQKAEDQQGVNAMSDALRARSPAAGGRASP